jgi:integrase
MARDGKYQVGDYWLDQRRDGRAKGIWQVARYDAASRSVVYRSTRTADVDEAQAFIHAYVERERAKAQRQDPHDARVIPHLFLYWRERGMHLANADQTQRSLKTFMGFLYQDEVGMNAVVTDLVPATIDRFRAWRMKPHAFEVDWIDGPFAYRSETGVSGDTVDRNLNDVRAAINHAADNMRIAYAPRIRGVETKHKNPLRERVLTMDELGRIFWYARQHSPALFRFVALQLCTSVRPEAAKRFNAREQYNDRTKLIDLQPQAQARTKKRNAIIPAIRPMQVVLRAWARDSFAPVESNKTAWRNMRKALGLSADVFPKTIRHTIATMLYTDPNVPERQVSEMLGHEGKLSRTTKLYAKYDPARLREAVAALTMIWRRISREARRFGADHLLTTGRNEQGKYVALEVRKR